MRTEQPLEFFADYFASVLAGTHVLLREFSYVNASERNRWALVTACRESFAALPPDEPTAALELAQLLRLLCPDVRISATWPNRTSFIWGVG